MKRLLFVTVTLLMLALCAPAVSLLAQSSEEEDIDKELEMLKRAWKRHQEEREEERSLEQSPEGLNDPLSPIIGKMRVVGKRLAREQVGKRTQQKEREVIDMLDSLIEALKKAQSQQQNQQQKNKGKCKKQPSPQSRPGTPQQQQLTDPNRLNPATPNSPRQKQILKKVKARTVKRPRGGSGSEFEKWGHLPGQLREAANSGREEKFHPKYKQRLEEYYKRLAEEKK